MDTTTQARHDHMQAHKDAQTHKQYLNYLNVCADIQMCVCVCVCAYTQVQIRHIHSTCTDIPTYPQPHPRNSPVPCVCVHTHKCKLDTYIVPAQTYPHTHSHILGIHLYRTRPMSAMSAALSCTTAGFTTWPIRTAVQVEPLYRACTVCCLGKLGW